MKILDVPQSGSVAGTTSSRNRFGQYRRSRATPVNPNSEKQQEARTRLTSFSIAWRSLTDAQREAWKSYSLEHPVTDSLGQSNVLTGFQQYVGVNSSLAQAGYTAVTDPPVSAAPDAPVIVVGVTTAAGLTVTVDGIADVSVIGESSPPLSAGRSFNKDFRVVTVGGDDTDCVITAANMTTKWGTLVAGQKFFLRFVAVGSDGARSAPATAEIVLT
jgi:hypothetical protein